MFWLILLGATMLISACGASGLPSAPASQPLDSSASEIPGAGNLPPGCEPLNLRSPTGERVVLDGAWTEVGDPNSPSPARMTWWLVTQGDCVWGAGDVDEVRRTETPPDTQSLVGRVGSDFTVTGDILWLGPVPSGLPFRVAPYSPLRMLIEFDDAGAILLREDREQGVAGPRCPEPTFVCPEPLLLERAD
jgi:hypothetical protein